MKRVLSLLLAFVFLRAETYALSGGPNYGGNVDIVGTYSGVLVQVLTPEMTESDLSGSLAVFTMAIPQTGLARGTTLVFSGGQVYDGTITGVGDVTSSNKASFKGILEASYDFTLSTPSTDSDGNPTVIVSSVTATANGTVDAEIFNTNVASTLTTLIKGTAQVLISNGLVNDALDPIINEVVDYQLTGFRQSTSVSSIGG